VLHYPSYADLIKGLRNQYHFCTIVTEKISEKSGLGLQGSIVRFLSIPDWDQDEKYSEEILLSYYDSQGENHLHSDQG